MADSQIEEVKSKIDIVELVGEYVELKKAGRNYKGLCPFHAEKTPSFLVTPELQIYKCFGCGVGGDVFRFVMDFEKMEFGEALKFLADKAGVKLKPREGSYIATQKDEIFKANSTAASFYNYLLTKHPLGEVARKYLETRGISDESTETFRLGFSPDNPTATFSFLTNKKNLSPDLLVKTGIVGKRESGGYYDRFRGRIIFPLFDHLGNTVGFAGRILDTSTKTAKYINTPETSVYKKGDLLYALNVTKQEIKKEGYAIVVEGELDCISSFQAGVKNVVAIKGSALTEAQLRLLSRFCSRIVLALDSDFAGDEASRRGIKIAATLGISLKVARVAPFKDPDEMARKDPEAWKKTVKNAQDVYEFLIDSVFNKFDPQTTEGKGAISREVAPVLAEIEDEILKAHLVKLVAERLGVGEQAVMNQASKFTSQGQRFSSNQGHSQFEEVKKAPENRTRRELLERHALTSIIQSNPTLLTDSKVESLITTPLAKKLYDFLRERIKEKGKLELATLSDGLPGELNDYLALVVLSQNEDDDPTFLKKETEDAIKNLETLDLKEKITLITEKIKEADRKNDEESLSRYERDLGQFTRKLAELELS